MRGAWDPKQVFYDLYVGSLLIDRFLKHPLLSICTRGLHFPFSSWKPIITFFRLWIFDVIDSKLLPDISLHIYSSYPLSSVRCSFSRVKTAIFRSSPTRVNGWVLLSGFCFGFCFWSFDTCLQVLNHCMLVWSCLHITLLTHIRDTHRSLGSGLIGTQWDRPV